MYVNEDGYLEISICNKKKKKKKGKMNKVVVIIRMRRKIKWPSASSSSILSVPNASRLNEKNKKRIPRRVVLIHRDSFD